MEGNHFRETNHFGRAFIELNGTPFTGTVYLRNTVFPNSGYPNGGTTSYTTTKEEQDSEDFLRVHSDSESMPDGEIFSLNVKNGLIIQK